MKDLKSLMNLNGSFGRDLGLNLLSALFFKSLIYVICWAVKIYLLLSVMKYFGFVTVKHTVLPTTL